MSQSDLNIANVSRSLFRQEANEALQALGSLSSGATEPTTTYAYQLWADTASGFLKQRTAANDSWINKGNLADVDWGFLNKAGGNMTGAINHAVTTLASAATPDIWTGTAKYINYTGTTEATGFAAAPQAGSSRTLILAAAASFTADANMLIDGYSSGATVTLAAGDRVEVLALSTTQFRLRMLRQDASEVIYSLIKADSSEPALTKTGADTLSIKAGTTVNLDSGAVIFSVDTAVTMPTLTAGTDYSVWVAPDGTAQAVADTFASPATAPVTSAVKIGGFHYGLVASGTTVAGGSFSTTGVTASGGSFGWTQDDVDAIAGINEFSLWDLAWRCAGEQYGMTFDPVANAWCGIYFMSDSPHLYGASAYNTNIASGTVLPYVPAEWGGNGTLKYNALNSWVANELVMAHGLRLPRYEEFVSFAFGVTEGQSLGGAASTVPATLRQAGYTSRIGIEQATGHQWAVGGPLISSNGTAYAAAGRGSWFGSTSQVLLGGCRTNAAHSGSRCASFGNALSDSNWSLSVRAAGDHLNLGVAAR